MFLSTYLQSFGYQIICALLGSDTVLVAELEHHPNTWENEFTLWESKIGCAEGKAIIQPSCYHEFSYSVK